MLRARSATAPLLALTVFAAVLFAVDTNQHDLWPPDEPRYAQVAREMLESGDWLVLRVNGEPYLEKPPLLFWAIAAVSAPFGDVTETTARIPSILAGLGVVVLTYLSAARLFGWRTAWWAGIILCTTMRFWLQARTAQIDMLLTLCLTLALLAFCIHHDSKQPRWLVVMYGAIAAAVYAKGPVGILFPLLMAGTFYWRRRDERRSLHLVLGLLAVAALIALWLIPARMAASTGLPEEAGQTIGSNLYRQTIGRMFLGVSKAQPFWYYCYTLPVDLMPWTLFLPWTVGWAWRRRKDEGVRLGLAWIVPALIVFSAFSGKRGLYLLPMYPVLAMLQARSVLDLVDGDHATWRRCTGYTWSLLLVAVALAPIGVWFSEYREMAVSPAVVIIACVGGACAIDALLLSIRTDARKLAGRVACGWALLVLLTVFLVIPVINPHKSARAFCDPLRILSEAGKDYRLYGVGVSREEYIYYAKHFHEPFLVDEFPEIDVPGLDPNELQAQVRLLAGGLRKAVEQVPVVDLRAVTDQELVQLESAASAVFALARDKTDLGDTPRAAFEQTIREFGEAFRGPEPAFLFTQQRDWRWYIVLDPTLTAFPVLDARSVGSRDMLLIANDAGQQLLAEGASS